MFIMNGFDLREEEAIIRFLANLVDGNIKLEKKLLKIIYATENLKEDYLVGSSGIHK